MSSRHSSSFCCFLAEDFLLLCFLEPESSNWYLTSSRGVFSSFFGTLERSDCSMITASSMLRSFLFLILFLCFSVLSFFNFWFILSSSQLVVYSGAISGSASFFSSNSTVSIIGVSGSCLTVSFSSWSSFSITTSSFSIVYIPSLVMLMPANLTSFTSAMFTATFSPRRTSSVLAWGLYGSGPNTFKIVASKIIRWPAWASQVSNIPSRIISDFGVSSNSSFSPTASRSLAGY